MLAHKHGRLTSDIVLKMQEEIAGHPVATWPRDLMKSLDFDMMHKLVSLEAAPGALVAQY